MLNVTDARNSKGWCAVCDAPLTIQRPTRRTCSVKCRVLRSEVVSERGVAMHSFINSRRISKVHELDVNAALSLAVRIVADFALNDGADYWIAAPGRGESFPLLQLCTIGRSHFVCPSKPLLELVELFLVDDSAACGGVVFLFCNFDRCLITNSRAVADSASENASHLCAVSFYCIKHLDAFLFEFSFLSSLLYCFIVIQLSPGSTRQKKNHNATHLHLPLTVHRNTANLSLLRLHVTTVHIPANNARKHDAPRVSRCSFSRPRDVTPTLAVGINGENTQLNQYGELSLQQLQQQNTPLFDRGASL
jgi:hypothetical protein